MLLKNGTTAHSRFKIPIKIHEDSISSIGLQTPQAEKIRQAQIIIWDEAPMAHKYCFHTVDKLLRDIMKKVNPLLANVPFGGKKFIIGGDFRQCLPVVLRGTRADIINASIKSSYLWNNIKSFSLTTNMRLSSERNLDYSKLLMNIGNGTETKTTINQFNDFKVHQPIILIRNLSNANGLCNGTRLMITSKISLTK